MNLPAPEELLRKSLQKKAYSRSIIHQYRESLIVLKCIKNYTFKEISGFYAEEGINIPMFTISSYLRKHPPSKEELAQLKSGDRKKSILKTFVSKNNTCTQEKNIQSQDFAESESPKAIKSLEALRKYCVAGPLKDRKNL